MQTTKEILIAAKALISDPAHWTQGEYSRNTDGRRTAHHDPAAVCWCAMGAIIRVLPLREYSRAVGVTETLAAWGAGGNSAADLVGFNDGHTHAEVLALFDKAIAECTQ